MVVPVAASALAMDSVDGQRARPAGVMRFDLLKVVGSRPARRASPDAESPARAARRSIADQTCACVSIVTPHTCPNDRNYCLKAQGPIGSRRANADGNAMTTVYKICSRTEWRAAEAQGEFLGSAVDLRD